MPCDGPQRIGRLEADRHRPGRAAASDRAILWWAMATLIAIPAAGGEGPPAAGAPTHHIPRLEAEISVDGELDEPVWSEAWTCELPFEVRPGENTPPPVPTEVLVFHDRTHLYVGFRAFDPDPSKIRAHLSDRDAAWADDWVGVVLDTFNDERRNYLLVVNPLGVQMDEIESWPGGMTAWDGIWRSAARIQPWGWSAEIAVPFSTLRFQRSAEPQVWGFDAIRGYSRDTFHQMGAFPRDRSNNCYLCQSLKVTGFAGASPGRNLEVVPTLTASRTDVREELPDGPLVGGDLESELGVTARWGMTPNLTLSGAVNPDFSQVEADARQLDINEPFALFYPEKRPFFMEGADYFDTPLRAVYTRMIREPAWGLKLTGKEGPHTIGGYIVQDDVTNLIIPGSQGSDGTSLNASNLATVLRYERDIGDRHTLGALITDREGDDYSNRVAGLDGDFRVTEQDRIMLQLLGSSTLYPGDVAAAFEQPSGDFEDLAAELVYQHETRTLSWWGVYKDAGTDFRADLGFMPRVDYRFGEVGTGYTWNATATSWYSRIDLDVELNHSEDQDGNLLEQEAAVEFTLQGPLESHATVEPSLHREGYRGEEFDLSRLLLSLRLKPSGNSQAWIAVAAGGQVDYTNVQQGDAVNLDLGLVYRLGRHLRFQLENLHETMDVDQGWLYRANIAQLEATWQLDVRTFIRAILQHVVYDYNTELYQDGRGSRDEELYAQLLFSYKVNPRTVVFVGYSEDSRGDATYDLTTAIRSVFVKLGYAWIP
jgi:hypothetical protein